MTRLWSIDLIKKICPFLHIHSFIFMVPCVRVHLIGLSIALWLLICLYATPVLAQAPDGVCRVADLESAGKRQKRGGWAIEQRCTSVDLRDFVTDAELAGRMSETNGGPITGAYVLDKLLQALEAGAQLGARVTSLNLAGCALRDADAPMLARLLAEDTLVRRMVAVQSRGAARSRRVQQQQGKGSSGSSSSEIFVLGSLQELLLERNQLGDRAVHLLVNSLSAQKKGSGSSASRGSSGVVNAAHNAGLLQRIDLRHNRLCLAGVSTLLHFAAHGSTMRSIDLRHNPAWADRALPAAFSASASASAASSAGTGTTVAGTGASSGSGGADPRLWWLQHYDARSHVLRVGPTGKERVLLTGPQPAARAIRSAGTGARASSVDTSSSSGADAGADSHSALRSERAVAIVARERDRLGLRLFPLQLANSRGLPEVGEGEGEGEQETAEQHMHEDDRWNTAAHAKDRNDKHRIMSDFLEECYAPAGPTVRTDTVIDARSLASTLYRLGHGSPHELLHADYDDLHTHLSPPLDILKIRLLLRCVCEYNYYFQEIELAERRAASEHQSVESKGELEDRHRTDQYLKVQGLSRTNAQKQKNIHSDVHNSRSHSTSTHATGQKVASGEVQYSMKRERADFRGALDYSGQAGLASGLKLCESQYFRKAHRGTPPSRPVGASSRRRSRARGDEL